MSTPTETQVDPKLADRVGLKAFAEACMVLEEGVAGVRDIDLGMMMGTGMIPGPFARADQRGLDEVLAALERAEAEWGEHEQHGVEEEDQHLPERVAAQARGRRRQPGRPVADH